MNLLEEIKCIKEILQKIGAMDSQIIKKENLTILSRLKKKFRTNSLYKMFEIQNQKYNDSLQIQESNMSIIVQLLDKMEDIIRVERLLFEILKEKGLISDDRMVKMEEGFKKLE